MQKFNAKKLALLAAALVTIAAFTAAGYYLISTRDSDADDAQDTQQEQTENTTQEINVIVETADDSQLYSHQLVAGESAFDVLNSIDGSNENFTFSYDEFDFGVMITSMNGVEPSSSQFWKFQINGTDSAVGISDYQVESGDVLSFVIEEIQF